MDLPMDVQATFDDVLDAVIEPQSELSVAELGLVKKITYYKADTTLVVYMNYAKPTVADCPACSVATDMMKSTIERDLKAALLEAFPGWTVRFDQ
ncbi:MAG TPA: hypothetical protein P5298_01325 [Spirochaetia bacterium]|nr:hypothetical protein [Spirochaetaceae bacterium]HPE89704.1 hypothetical protein [Spirochaetales bacterium]HRW23035.1 hypothetical protein [Spirochaetia bacterium]